MSALWMVTTTTHWLGFAALAGLIGSLALDALVLPAGLAEVAAAAARLRRWRALCLIILFVATAAELVIRAHTMAGDGIVSALDATPAVLSKTTFGGLWIGRLLMLGLATSMIAVVKPGARMVSLALALGVALTTSLTGHAADRGDLSWSVGLDWLHVVAATAWTGGLIGLTVAVFVDATAWPDEILRLVARRFSRLAGWCLLAVVASGTFNTWVQVRQLSSMWTTTYGRVLSVKLLFVLALASLGAVNRYVILPALLGRRAGHARSTAPSRLRTYVGVEALLAAVVFACTAVLIDTTPARHGRHLKHESGLEQPRELERARRSCVG
jgi:copper resistance protein D